MRAWYSPSIPLPTAQLAFEIALEDHFDILYAMDNVVIADASTTPLDLVSATIYGFAGDEDGDLKVTITLNEEDAVDGEVSRRGIGHRVVPFNSLPYAEIHPVDQVNIFAISEQVPHIGLIFPVPVAFALSKYHHNCGDEIPTFTLRERAYDEFDDAKYEADDGRNR
ncbi:hypothetical protein EYR40_000389 [Pleurotus pulmonarius]|nr:hypothetical protein EYR40_000389 [Pleurotus pulmonarius]